MIENLANLDPMIMGAVGVLVLALIIVVDRPDEQPVRAARAAGAAPEHGRRRRPGGARDKGGAQDPAGMKRKDIEAKLKAAEQIKGQRRGYKLQEKLIQAGLKTTPKQFWMYSLDLRRGHRRSSSTCVSGIVYTIPAGFAGRHRSAFRASSCATWSTSA